VEREIYVCVKKKERGNEGPEYIKLSIIGAEGEPKVGWRGDRGYVPAWVVEARIHSTSLKRQIYVCGVSSSFAG